jgi:hypothetical protein
VQVNEQASAERGAARIRSVLQSPRAPIFVAAALVLAGILMRLPIAFYHGQPTQPAFNDYIFKYLGGYSDIASLYFRDHLSVHPAPYFDYRLEYPVVTGGFIWLTSFINGSVVSYMFTTAAVLGACGLASAWLIRRFDGANVWIFALAPALATELVLNWDVLGIFLTLIAMALYLRKRDAWGGAALGFAVWAKLFPIFLLPLVILVRVRERKWRELARGSFAFATVSLIVNLPVAWQHGSHGWVVRQGWAYFFKFNQERLDALDIWSFARDAGLHLAIPQINSYDTALMAAWSLVVIAAAYYMSARKPPATLIAPALLSLIAFFFFVNKVYSPQYGLWVIALLAVVGAPLALAVPFLIIDLAYFLTGFIALMISSTSGSWYSVHIMRPTAALRELLLLGISIWGLRAMLVSRAAAGVVPEALAAPVRQGDAPVAKVI